MVTLAVLPGMLRISLVVANLANPGNSRSLSEKQVKVDKDLRRADAERFFVFRGIPHFVPGGEIRKSLLEFGLILGQPPRSASGLHQSSWQTGGSVSTLHLTHR